MLDIPSFARQTWARGFEREGGCKPSLGLVGT